MPPPAIDTERVIDVLHDGDWAGGTSLVLRYSTPTINSVWPTYGPSDEQASPDFRGLNTAQRVKFTTAMELWDECVQASFVKTNDPGNPGSIRVAFTGMEDDPDTWGYAYVPSLGQSPADNGYEGDIWISADYTTSNFALGGFDFEALLHEIGHALGLDHTFDEDEPSVGDFIDPAYDDTRYSVMSYTTPADAWTPVFSGPNANLSVTWNYVGAITPMMFDILAIQHMYGVSTTTRAGATEYTFDPDFACFQTIFDSGGIDTWKLGGHSRASIIDLRPASFSSIDIFSVNAQIDAACAVYGESNRDFFTDEVFLPGEVFAWTDNVAIAYGTIIENVFCGNANDRVLGNSVANDVRGWGGNDVLNGGAGADTLDGGLGADNLLGGVGSDILKGYFGHDTLTGNAGTDTFKFNTAASAANADTIRDFVSGTDKIVFDDAAFTALGGPGALAADAYYVGAAAYDASDRIIYDDVIGKLYYDADGIGGAAQIEIATLNGAPPVALADLFVI